MRDAPDRYLSDTLQTTSINEDNSPETNDQNISSCNEQKQPLLDAHISNHIQFDQERNLSYLSISTSPTMKRKGHMNIHSK